LEKSLQGLGIDRDQFLYWAFALLIIVSSFSAIWLDQVAILAIPVGIIFLATIVNNYRLVYLLFFFLLPFSIEYSLPGGFGTDLPSEPLMLCLSFLFILLLVTRITTTPAKILTHPISIVVVVHLLWLYFISLFSVDQVVSYKYTLARSWYIIPFYFLSFYMIDNKDVDKSRNIFKLLWIGLAIAISYVMIRHAALGFTFKTVNESVKPIFRNHVNYAAMMVVFLPFLVYLRNGSKHKWLYSFSILLLIMAIYLTYTRAAHLCVFIGIGVFFVIKYKLSKYAIGLAAVLIIFIFTFLRADNTYMYYEPDFEKTVTHYKFDNLLEATIKMQDISTVERFYRWIAGVHMINAKPLTGFGPGTFYPYYRHYTVTSYKTYVSDNPEKSGMHNNYLLSFVEQGVIGFIIMLFLCLFPIIYGEIVYHRLSPGWQKNLVMASVVSITICCCLLLMNELLESDKIGPLFFIALSIVAIMDTGVSSLVKENK
jgi:O-antigen ligase